MLIFNLFLVNKILIKVPNELVGHVHADFKIMKVKRLATCIVSRVYRFCNISQFNVNSCIKIIKYYVIRWHPTYESIPLSFLFLLCLKEKYSYHECTIRFSNCQTYRISITHENDLYKRVHRNVAFWSTNVLSCVNIFYITIYY